MTKKPSENWEAAPAYDSYMGRWSAVIAPEFLRWLSVRRGKRWLDIGCGTGVLTSAILASAEPALVKGIDPSDGFVRFAAERVTDPRVVFSIGDAESLQEEADMYDVVVSGLVLNLIKRPAVALAEAYRVVAPGGIVAAYIWDYGGKMELTQYFWDAASSLDPSAAKWDQGTRFPICQPDVLADHFKKTGLAEVDVRAIDARSVFDNFEDYWSPFLGGAGSAPTYVATLSDPARSRLRSQILEDIPVEADGTIRLGIRAWAAMGKRPAS